MFSFLRNIPTKANNNNSSNNNNKTSPINNARCMTCSSDVRVYAAAAGTRLFTDVIVGCTQVLQKNEGRGDGGAELCWILYERHHDLAQDVTCRLYVLTSAWMSVGGHRYCPSQLSCSILSISSVRQIDQVLVITVVMGQHVLIPVLE